MEKETERKLKDYGPHNLISSETSRKSMYGFIKNGSRKFRRFKIFLSHILIVATIFFAYELEATSYKCIPKLLNVACPSSDYPNERMKEFRYQSSANTGRYIICSTTNNEGNVLTNKVITIPGGGS